MDKSVLYPALRVAGIYTLVGILWIIASDQFLASAAPDVHWIIEVSMYKGWFFVLASGMLIYFLLRRELRDRVRAESAVQDSGQRYRSLFEHMIEGFAWCKMIYEDGRPQDFVYLDVNESFARLTGLKDVVGKRVTEVIPGIRETDPELFEIYGRVAWTGNAEKFETYLDSLGIWFALSVYSPAPEHFIAVFDNITDRRRAEEALRQSEERNRLLASVLELSSQPFASGWSDGRLNFFNRAFCTLVGYTEEEMSSVNWDTDLTPPEYHEMESRNLTELIRTCEPVRYEKEYVRKDGSRVPVELLTHVATDDGGKPLYYYAFVTDLTARKEAEEALRTSEEELRLTLDATSDGIWKWDFNANEMTVSDTWYTMLGYEPGEFPATYESWLSLLHPDDVQRTRAVTEAFASSRSDVYNGEFRLRTKDNQYRWIQSRARVVQRAESGAPRRLIGNHRDITEQKTSEETVKRERDKLKGILDVFNDGVYIVNAHHEIEYVNPVMEATFGPVSGRKCYEYLHERANCCPLCHNGEVLDGHSTQWEFYYARAGKTFDIFETPIGADDGSVSKLVFFHDITERKRAEEDRIQLATAIEQVGETVVITDASGRIAYVNPAFERTTGYSREEAIGNNPRMVKSGHHDERFYKHMWKTIAGGHIWKGHLITKRKDGDLFEEEATISPIKDDSGTIVNYVAVKRDVTREVSLQQQLLQAQKMEAVGTLAGGVAHDFNNLLQVTLGYSELLLHDKKEEDPEFRDLQKIFQAARSGAELVRSLLTFSRKVEPKFIPLNLNRQIKRVETLLKRTIPKMIDIQLHLDADLREIYADPTQVEQVLMNLAVNAKDAMSDGGRLIIETKNIPSEEIQGVSGVTSSWDGCVLLKVSDTGHGMDTETLEHIFEPFFTTKELGRGTGLGLAVVYGIVHQHGGYIRCESAPDVGTTFFLYFPSIDVHEEAEPEGISLPATGSETILLVDDEEAVRDLGRRILTKAGYTVLLAENGEEALELFAAEKKHISLVVLDLIMPRMGGKDCLKELMQVDPRTRVLIASGFLADVAPREYMGLGAKGFVTKPFRLRELLERVRQALDES